MHQPRFPRHLLGVARSTSIGLIALATVIPCAADSSSTKTRTVSKLAEGVYEIRHPDAPDGFPQSNTTVIIGARDVLVVDTCLLPSAANEDIAQIKKWTDKPVRFIVNTHWHFDHTLGNATYAAAFPDVEIIAQTETLKTIAAYNPGAVERYHTRAARFHAILDSGKNPDGTPTTAADRKDYETAIAGLAPVVEEMKKTSQLVPNISFDSSMSIDLGARPVKILFLGRGNTAGDTVVFLPSDKILCTGDLIDHPIPYLYGGLTTEQAATLKRMSELDADTIVPGHGDVLHGKAYIALMIDLLNTVNAAVEKAINASKTVEETQEIVAKDVDSAAWRLKFVGSDPDEGGAFDQTFTSLVKNSYNLIKAR